MSRKTTPSRPKSSTPASRTRKTEPAKPSSPIAARAAERKKAKLPKPGRASSAKSELSEAAQLPPRPSPGAAPAASSPAELLHRAEHDLAAAVESLNNQMGTALNAITELAVSQRGRGAAVVRTAPLDRATATFQRLIAEVVDDQLSEMLPSLIALRNEMAQQTSGDGSPGERDADLCQRGVAMLDQVLATARVCMYNARPGETFDPLIHLAVGETHCGDLADGAVAEAVQCGFRSDRGRVIAPARVKVNRR